MLESTLSWLILTINLTGFTITYETSLWECPEDHFQRRLAQDGRPSLKASNTPSGTELPHWVRRRKKHSFPLPDYWQNVTGMSFSCCHPFFIMMTCILKPNQPNPSFPQVLVSGMLSQQWENITSQTLNPSWNIFKFLLNWDYTDIH